MIAVQRGQFRIGGETQFLQIVIVASQDGQFLVGAQIQCLDLVVVAIELPQRSERLDTFQRNDLHRGNRQRIHGGDLAIRYHAVPVRIEMLDAELPERLVLEHDDGLVVFRLRLLPHDDHDFVLAADDADFGRAVGTRLVGPERDL